MSDQPTSTLAQIIAGLESGNGAYAGNQPVSMANPTYGQYSPFVQQYGDGATGVDAYAQAMLNANPNATLGDYYAGYVLGTGNPANAPTLEQLQAQYPSAYNNLVNNSGYDLSTPLSSLTGMQTVPTGDTSAQGYGTPNYGDAYSGDIPSSVNITPNLFGSTTAPSSTSSFGTQQFQGTDTGGGILGTLTNAAAGFTSSILGSIGLGGLFGSSGSLSPQVVQSATTALGKSIVQGADTATGAKAATGANWFTRGILIVLAVVLISAALWALMKPQAAIEKIGNVAKAAA